MNNHVESLVSIIIPIFNVEIYLSQCIDSALKQTHHNIEVVLIDDGSSDNSSYICDKYVELDGRIVVCHQQNGGPSAARNRGMEIAKGEYIYFLDSDDYIDDSTIEVLYKEAKTSDLDVILFDSKLVRESETNQFPDNYYIRTSAYSETSTGTRLYAKMIHNCEYHCSVPLLFIRHDLLVRKSISFYDGILHEDELFTFQLLMQSEKVKHVPYPFYNRRVRDNSIMTKPKSEKHFIGCSRVFTEMMRFHENGRFDDFVDAALRKHISEVFLTALYIYYSLGRNTRREHLPEKNSIVKQIGRAQYLGNRTAYMVCRFGRAYFTLRSLFHANTRFVSRLKLILDSFL